MRIASGVFCSLLIAGGAVLRAQQSDAAPKFAVSFSAERSKVALDGRVLLLLSTDPSAEPRMQIDNSPRSQMVFGVDVDGLQPGKQAIVDGSADGYPEASLRDVKPGEYTVQVVLHRYETFHRSDGKTVKLPMDRGEGQHWNIAPGNLYSKPQKITIAKDGKTFAVVMDQEIPPIAQEADTKYVRHVRIQSELLTKFWGKPMFPGSADPSAGGI